MGKDDVELAEKEVQEALEARKSFIEQQAVLAAIEQKYTAMSPCDTSWKKARQGLDNVIENLELCLKLKKEGA